MEFFTKKRILTGITGLLITGSSVFAAIPQPIAAECAENLANNTSIVGKIICGYQGWFNAEGDGANLGFKHYVSDGKFEPGYCSVDYWPDMSEMGSGEKYPTKFHYVDGTVATTCSSRNPNTVNRHFKWMKEYGIDGVFVQRFVSTMKSEKLNVNLNKVYELCDSASLNNNRLIGVMYDLSGSGPECVEYIKKDWKILVDKYKIKVTGNTNYLTYKEKPLVAIWGVGFKDRKYTLQNVEELIRYFKDDPEYGGCSVLLGIPTYWREQIKDCIADPQLHTLLKRADIIHPWTVGRYATPAAADLHKPNYAADKLWCAQNGMGYMPVVFPGFSWHNLKKGEAPLNQTPRLKGEFFWRQMYNAISSDVDMIYVAMFDEMDEGTCIFKCADNPPVGESPFVNYEGLPSDFYLWLTGRAGAMLRKEVPLQAQIPVYQSNNKNR